MREELQRNTRLPGNNIEMPSLAEATAPFRGFGGWVRKQAFFYRNTKFLPDAIDELIGRKNLSVDDQEALLDVRQSFVKHFGMAVAKNAVIPDNIAARMVNTLEKAVSLWQTAGAELIRQVKQEPERLRLTKEGRETLVNHDHNIKSIAEIVETLDKIRGALLIQIGENN